jgi:hypothetical protein
MRKALIIALVLTFALAICAVAEDAKVIRGTTDDGRKVLLKSDGTWSFVQQSANASVASSNVPHFVKSARATKKIDARFGQYAVWIDPDKWHLGKNEENKMVLESSNGKGYVMILSEALPVPTSTLREIALHNAQKADPNAHAVSEEKRVVNNHEILCMQIDASMQKLPFTYYGYYYGGSSGNIQLVAYTLQSVFAGMKSDFTDLLNGLKIRDTPMADVPSSTVSQFQTISMNAGKIKVEYDSNKWHQKVENNKITLSHVKGGGGAIIIPETITVPMNSFPEIALENAKSADPDAKIIFREKRVIHGLEVWCLKIAATVSKIPFMYYGYYYGGDANSVQVIAYTTSANFGDYEADFAELLNSLQLAQSAQASAK